MKVWDWLHMSVEDLDEVSNMAAFSMDTILPEFLEDPERLHQGAFAKLGMGQDDPVTQEDMEQQVKSTIPEGNAAFRQIWLILNYTKWLQGSVDTVFVNPRYGFTNDARLISSFNKRYPHLRNWSESLWHLESPVFKDVESLLYSVKEDILERARVGTLQWEVFEDPGVARVCQEARARGSNMLCQLNVMARFAPGINIDIGDVGRGIKVSVVRAIRDSLGEDFRLYGSEGGMILSEDVFSAMFPPEFLREGVFPGDTVVGKKKVEVEHLISILKGVSDSVAALRSGDDGLPKTDPFPERDMKKAYFKVVDSPLSAATVTEVAPFVPFDGYADAYVASQGSRPLRVMARCIADQSRHVTFAEFREALANTVDALHEAHPGGVVILTGSVRKHLKSDTWVTWLALQHAQARGWEDWVKAVYEYDDIVAPVLRFGNKYPLVQVDDMAYSGNQGFATSVRFLTWVATYLSQHFREPLREALPSLFDSKGNLIRLALLIRLIKAQNVVFAPVFTTQAAITRFATMPRGSDVQSGIAGKSFPKCIFRFKTTLFEPPSSRVFPAIYTQAVDKALLEPVWGEGTDEERQSRAFLALWLLVGKLVPAEQVLEAHFPASAVYFDHKFADTTSTSWRFWRHGTGLRNTPESRRVAQAVLLSVSTGSGVVEDQAFKSLFSYSLGGPKDIASAKALVEAILPPDEPDMSECSLTLSKKDRVAITQPLIQGCASFPDIETATERSPRTSTLLVDTGALPFTLLTPEEASKTTSHFLLLLQHSSDEDFADANLALWEKTGLDAKEIGPGPTPFAQATQNGQRCFLAVYKTPKMREIYRDSAGR